MSMQTHIQVSLQKKHHCLLQLGIWFFSLHVLRHSSVKPDRFAVLYLLSSSSLCVVCLHFKVFQSFLFLCMLFLAALIWLYNSYKVSWEIVPGWWAVQQRIWGRGRQSWWGTTGGIERRTKIRPVTSHPPHLFSEMFSPDKIFGVLGDNLLQMQDDLCHKSDRKINSENLERSQGGGGPRLSWWAALTQQVDADRPKPLFPAVSIRTGIRNSGEQLAEQAVWLQWRELRRCMKYIGQYMARGRITRWIIQACLGRDWGSDSSVQQAVAQLWSGNACRWWSYECGGLGEVGDIM